MLLPKITKQQQTILLLLYRFRFLNRLQIQTLLKHRTFNRVNVWLKDLAVKEYIGKIQDTSLKLNIVPTTYHIKKNGIRYLKTISTCKKEYIERLYTDAKRSKEFIKRCDFTAEVYLYLKQKYTNNPNFNFYTQSDFSVEGIIKEVFPYFVYRKGENEPYFIAEIISNTMPRFAIRARINQYIHFFTKSDWNINEQGPNILFICPDSKTERYIYNKAKKFLEDEDSNLNLFVSTLEQIKTNGIEGEIWEQVQ